MLEFFTPCWWLFNIKHRSSTSQTCLRPKLSPTSVTNIDIPIENDIVHRFIMMRFLDNWTFCTVYFLEHCIIPILAMICLKFFWCAKILIIFRLVCLFLVLKIWNSTNHETKNRSKLTCIRPEINSRKFPKQKFILVPDNDLEHFF